MTIEIKPEAWTQAHDAEVNAAFAGHAKSDASGGLLEPTEYLRDGVFCRVWKEGQPVAWYVVMPHRHAHTLEIEIALAHGRADIDLVADVLPLIEYQCREADAIRVTTCRPGLIKKLKRVGYRCEAVVLRKKRGKA
ncbi:hypothetical protein [Cupriavidus oxalaticus]|uniref:hypothetical protein n=1 Tax=Cupriavidus oxalaticus TaxID=96344 RepID=UPI004033A568